MLTWLLMLVQKNYLAFKKSFEKILKSLALNTVGIIGIIAGVFTSASLLPQLIKIRKEKKVEDLSIAMFVSLLVGLILWVLYGILRNDWPIIVTNGFSALLNFYILILRYKYRRS